MNNRQDQHPRQRLAALSSGLLDWLAVDAYPLWSRQGIDSQNGGFIETLDHEGKPLPHARRARVHPRQCYSFAEAPGFGWRGDAAGIVARGMEYFAKYYSRPDGLFRTLAAADGSPLDDTALLYDQAFALLGFAAAARALDARREFEARALELRHAIETRLRAADGAFHTDESRSGNFESNPHMHLLEACLAWEEIGADPGWTEWSLGLVQLALSHFIRRDTGALGESFTQDWQPAPGIAGRIIEPGHQFEWCWLLLRCEARVPLAQKAALRLFAVGEHHGVHHGVAVNQLTDDFQVHDGNARFWPQTERLKAALFAASLTGEDQYWTIAHDAAVSFFPYLDTSVKGLWFDVQRPDGILPVSLAPASTFYHLVGAIAALKSSVC